MHLREWDSSKCFSHCFAVLLPLGCMTVLYITYFEGGLIGGGGGGGGGGWHIYLSVKWFDNLIYKKCL